MEKVTKQTSLSMLLNKQKDTVNNNTEERRRGHVSIRSLVNQKEISKVKKVERKYIEKRELIKKKKDMEENKPIVYIDYET